MRKKYRRTTSSVILIIFIVAVLCVCAVVFFIYQSGYRYIKSDLGIKFFGDTDKYDNITKGRLWFESDAANVSLQKYFIVGLSAGLDIIEAPQYSMLSISDFFDFMNNILAENYDHEYPLGNFIFNRSDFGAKLKTETLGEILDDYESLGVKLVSGEISSASNADWAVVLPESGFLYEIAQADDSSKKYKGSFVDFFENEEISFASLLFDDGSSIYLYPVRSAYNINYDKGPRLGELYIGEINSNFQKNGRGLYYYLDSGDIYYGDFFEDEKTGSSQIYSSNGDIYIGNISDGKKNGEGYFMWGDDGSYYSGTFLDNMKNGYGHYQFADGSLYEGDYVNDVKHGKGKFVWTNGDSYEGDYENDLYKGFGRYTWSNGDYYEGDFDHNTLHGWGTYYWTSGRSYEGYWDLGKMVLPDERPDDVEDHDLLILGT